MLRPGLAPYGGLCAYADALALMDALVARPPDAPDVLLSLQHPPTLTLGRRGGGEHLPVAVAGQISLQFPGHGAVRVDVHEIARGGSITWHAPGQLVVYPIVQLARLEGPVGRGPLGDLPAFVRLLELAMQETCRVFGVTTVQRDGFAGLWIDDKTKIASIGVGLRSGWSFHGLALNVNPHLDAFAGIVPCGLDGVRMTSLWRELDLARMPRPALAEVEAELVEGLKRRLRRALRSYS